MSEKIVITLKREGNLWVAKLGETRYGFRKWTWGEKNAAAQAATEVNPMSGMAFYNGSGFNLSLFRSTIFKEADGKFVPFTDEEIKSLEAQLGDTLFQITQKLNLVQPFETQNL